MYVMDWYADSSGGCDGSRGSGCREGERGGGRETKCAPPRSERGQARARTRPTVETSYEPPSLPAPRPLRVTSTCQPFNIIGRSRRCPELHPAAPPPAPLRYPPRPTRGGRGTVVMLISHRTTTAARAREARRLLCPAAAAGERGGSVVAGGGGGLEPGPPLGLKAGEIVKWSRGCWSGGVGGEEGGEGVCDGEEGEEGRRERRSCL